MNTVLQTIDWYKRNHDNPPFDPDGMCLKICRTARGIPAMFPSAVAAQNATPQAHRVFQVSKIRRGMVVYYDDPRDGNPYGHIVTVHGRVKDADPNSLHDLLVWTNSVVANKIVLVRGDYFPKFWGDEYKFAATWLNGQELVFPERPARVETVGKGKRLRAAIKILNEAIDHHDEAGNNRIVRALRRDVNEIRETLERWEKK